MSIKAEDIKLKPNAELLVGHVVLNSELAEYDIVYLIELSKNTSDKTKDINILDSTVIAYDVPKQYNMSVKDIIYSRVCSDSPGIVVKTDNVTAAVSSYRSLVDESMDIKYEYQIKNRAYRFVAKFRDPEDDEEKKHELIYYVQLTDDQMTALGEPPTESGFLSEAMSWFNKELLDQQLISNAYYVLNRIEVVPYHAAEINPGDRSYAEKVMKEYNDSLHTDARTMAEVLANELTKGILIGDCTIQWLLHESGYDHYFSVEDVREMASKIDSAKCNKKIIFVEGYTYAKNKSLGGYLDWYNTQKAIDEGLSIIVTSQMGMMSFDLMDKGYRIYIVDHAHGKPTEIKLGSNPGVDKELRREHNLFKLWSGGYFDDLPEGTDSVTNHTGRK